MWISQQSFAIQERLLELWREGFTFIKKKKKIPQQFMVTTMKHIMVSLEKVRLEFDTQISSILKFYFIFKKQEHSAAIIWCVCHWIFLYDLRNLGLHVVQIYTHLFLFLKNKLKALSNDLFCWIWPTLNLLWPSTL